MSSRIKFVLELTAFEAETLLDVVRSAEWDGYNGKVMQDITNALTDAGVDDVYAVASGTKFMENL